MMPGDLSDTSQNRSDDFVSDSGNVNKRDQDKPRPYCCVTGNFTFHSIDDILNNISSNNTILNITNDVELSSIVTLEGLENIMIIGHRNPVVKCNDVGAVKFIYFKNITIEGIQWEGCGSKDYPGIEFYNSSDIYFERCSFYNSKGKSVLLSEVSGSAILHYNSSDISIESCSFYNSTGQAVVLSNVSGNINISSCTFTHNNHYTGHGGAIHYTPKTSFISQLIIEHSNFSFNSIAQSVIYLDGSAAKHLHHNSVQNSVFISNQGVPIYILHTNLHLSGNVLFRGNKARTAGGIYSNYSTVIYDDKCSVNFEGNSVEMYGGAIYQSHSTQSFEGNSVVTFIGNSAEDYGGAVFSDWMSHITLEGSSNITFTGNEASDGGAVYCRYSSITVIFNGNSHITFTNNKAEQHGGAIHCDRYSDIYLEENISMIFTGNTAERGGAISIIQSSITLNSSVSTIFEMNSAENGGAISIQQSTITFSEKLMFINNTARGNGGAIHLNSNSTAIFNNDSDINFFYNTANQYGGAIYTKLFPSDTSKLIFNTEEISFNSNAALTGSGMYIDIPTSCNETCLNSNIVGINKRSLLTSPLNGHITTTPSKLEFYNIKCVYNHTNTSCNIYIMKNVMLGHDIIIDACVRDHYNRPTDTTLFAVSGNDRDHRINGTQVLVSCTVFQGTSVIGERIFDAINFSINITSNQCSRTDLQTISVELITELSPCHPGFHYDNTTCVCYSDSDIVSCSGSTSFIKRGYWYGEVNDKATVTVCPNSYCNFACCETANGFFKLSPDRVNQCNSQRSGTACGSCKEGYTLSFDSIECVSVDTCTTGQTVLVVTLSILYWVVIVILVFIVTYYHIGIGYLYTITYYYSMVDILLSEQLYSSQGLFTFVSIMSSIAKVTPQFLGQLCLVTDMSGIDQQFIHYVHPLAVAIIIVVICLSARISYKFSSYVSRGIIHVISFLLLLSYTSVTTTSLLLFRSLTFHNLDKVYTYLSPDIEYFHGRHLPYVIIAIVCSLIIVMGLPLLLLLEPFLNHKINFTRIKPFLDQFQGCYKDKYRSFAAYYMACRLVIILIIIANPSNNNTTQYLLIIANSTLALIHLMLKPYGSNILNMFDGFVLQLMIVVSMVPLIDSYDPDLLLSFMFVLVILPLIPFLIMEIYLYKKTIKKITKYCVPSKPDTTNDNNEIPMREEFVDSVIDDSKRVNATICEIRESEMDDATHYRESFMEVMDEIKD
ncbi:uncharacterized protein [Dysidea avara]|uniref:uncharacterized protein n=1 Tax=Dysidea avara TaxID=196820 RepID=UPI0033243A24